MGDDWFPQRRVPGNKNMPYIYDQGSNSRQRHASGGDQPLGDYDMYLQAENRRAS